MQQGIHGRIFAIQIYTSGTSSATVSIHNATEELMATTTLGEIQMWQDRWEHFIELSEHYFYGWYI